MNGKLLMGLIIILVAIGCVLIVSSVNTASYISNNTTNLTSNQSNQSSDQTTQNSGSSHSFTECRNNFSRWIKHSKKWN